MKILFVITLLILLAPAILIGQTYLEIREKIVPLQSKRDDVEKIAKLIKNQGNFVLYELDGKRLEVYYNSAECLTYGWKVPKDTVIEFNYYPSHDELSYDEIKKTFVSIETTDDTLTRYITDRDRGILYVSSNGTSNVERINFMPPAGYSKLRCNGFPDYDPSRMYSWYQRLKIEDPKNWDPDEVYPTIFSTKQFPTHKVTIFIYCKKGDESKYRKVKKIIERFASLTIGSTAKKINIAFGGYRKDLEIETFVLPENYPAVIPSPTHPS
jgi:hypothetical protein